METSSNTSSPVVQSSVSGADDPSIFSPRFLSTKFVLAFIFTVVGCTALLLHIFDPTTFNWLVGIILGGHGTTNIIDKKLNGDQQP